jgi:signal transduction histidine kinase
MNPPQDFPAYGELVLNQLAFLDSAADFWIFLSFLLWLLSLNMALEGRLLAHRRSINERVWLGGSLLCGIQAVQKLQELLVFSFDSLRHQNVNATVHLSLAVAALAVLFLTFRRFDGPLKWKRGLIGGGILILAIDFGFTYLATDSWSREGLMTATHPVLQSAIGINGQVLIALAVFLFVAWQTGSLRIEQQSPRFFAAEGAALITIAVVTYFLCHALYNEALRGRQAREFELAQNAVLAIPLAEARQLHGDSTDTSLAAYRSVRDHLTRFRKANPSISDIFLWRIQDGQRVVLASSERHGQPDIPPGHAFGKADARDLAANSLEESWSEGPFRTPQGVISIVNERIATSADDPPLAWLRVDFTTRDWLSTFASRRILLLAAATLLSVLVVAVSNYRSRAIDDVKVERGKQLAAEAERVRLGRDIHDDLGQLLFAINIQSNILASTLDPDSEDGKLSRELCVLAQRAADTSREIAHGLVPEDGDFRLTFRKFCLDTANTLRVSCEVHDEFGELTLRREARVALMRVAQESINNAVRHGQATQIDVSLAVDGHTLQLLITDNGAGFRHRGQQSGIGTSVMRARIEDLGGNFSLTSRREAGVEVSCTLPVKQISAA